MQRNEVIIEQFVKTIKESPLEVTGDPVLLNNIFEELKKKKRRKIFNIFLFSSFALVVLSFVVWGMSVPASPSKESKAMVEPLTDLTSKIPESIVLTATTPAEDHKNVSPVKKINKTTTQEENTDFTNVVSYKFNNHQVDVFENGGQEFIQINVFGADGVEQDVLKIMEDLKKSYKKNEVYVDSVKHK